MHHKVMQAICCSSWEIRASSIRSSSLRRSTQTCTSFETVHIERCGEMSNQLGHHHLIGRRYTGHLPHHTAINATINRALVSAGISSMMEPRGLDTGDGCRPDDMTMTHLDLKTMLLLDAACVNTIDKAHLIDWCITESAAARAAWLSKIQKYTELGQRCAFLPLVVETTGVLGSPFQTPSQEMIGNHTYELRETAWPCHRSSLAVVHDEAAGLIVSLWCIYVMLLVMLPRELHLED